MRFLKYIYLENKFKVNIILLIIVCTIILFNLFTKSNIDIGVINTKYNISGIGIEVVDSYIVNEDYEGNKLNSYLLIVSINLSSISKKSINLNDFSIILDNKKILPTNYYDKYLIDLGDVYNNEILSKDYKNYLIVFDLGKNYKNLGVSLKYKDVLKIKLNSKKVDSKKNNISKILKDEIIFEKPFNDIIFSINDYKIDSKFKINYNFCSYSKCINSSYYIKASIDENFDKYVLFLDINYKSNKYTFYDFFSKYGSIYYKVDSAWKIQNSNFENIINNKVLNNNHIYIGVDKEIYYASNIKLVFKIRKNVYEYVLK